MKALERSLERHFPIAIGICCALYLGLETLYVLRLPLVMDEFQGARAVHRLMSETPYVDFRPYKTVLGYYLQLPPMWLAKDPWQQLMLVKLAMAFVTAGSIFAAARILRRHYATTAVVLATLVLVCMSTFLERSAALRVDMLTGLFGLFGLLFLLERRLLLAGSLAGLSFLVSQKGAYYILCSGFALGIYWLLHARDRRAFVECLRFTGAALVPIFVYFAFWTILASLGTVSHEVFVKNQDVALTRMYEIRHFWLQTVQRNPYFWGMTVLALGQLFVARGRSEQPFRDWILLAYGGSLLALGIWHKQPWPYFFVLLIPTAWILVTSLLDAEFRRASGITRVSLAALLILGVAYPVSRVPSVLARDNTRQRHAVETTHAILERNDGYLAGLSFVHTRSHVPARLGWLDARRLDSLSTESPETIISWIRADPPKVLVYSYRIPRLPPAVLQYLQATYAPYSGNVFVYAPTIEPESEPSEISIAGQYLVSGPPGATLDIDGRRVDSGDSIRLDAGPHRIAADRPFRLVLEPDGVERSPDPRLERHGTLFEEPYTY